MPEDITIYEIWDETYDTFGDSGTILHSRWKNEDAAEFVAERLTELWGHRAHVRPADNTPIREHTLAEVERLFRKKDRGQDALHRWYRVFISD